MGNHLSIESNGPQRISVSHPGSHFGRFRRPAGYGVMGGRPRRSPHPQEPPQAGSAAQRRPAGARGAGRWPRVVAGRAESTPPCHLTQPIISSVRPGGRGRQGRGPGARHPPVGKKRAFKLGSMKAKIASQMRRASRPTKQLPHGPRAARADLTPSLARRQCTARAGAARSHQQRARRARDPRTCSWASCCL